MAHKDIEEAVEKLLDPLLAQEGMELVDVEYVRERNWILRIFIDKEGGVDLNDCQYISEKAGKLLDEKDLIPAEYMLEVSSPGLDRILKKDKDFKRFAGEEVDVKLFTPLPGRRKKTLTAQLKGLDDEGRVLLHLQDGQDTALDRKQISQIRLHFSF